MLDLFQEGCCGLELCFHENYKSLSNLWVDGGLGEGKEPQEKEQVSVPIRRPTGETETEILLEKHNAADVGRNSSPSSVVPSVINKT